ncbi:MAG: class I SAM-dependent methyltransferase [Phycisphaerae bacterium]|nr:class I SAM-dependent methyltransferase [Phycisphaerae bacterium]
MSTNRTCCICGYENIDPRDVNIHSNVREFAAEKFPVWRCGGCKSIHSRDEVDLDKYYERYPFFAQKLDWVLSGGYRRLLGRLKSAGLRRTDRIIDYGCGSGLLVKYLCRAGYNAVGYDPYSKEHGDPAVLESQYDVLIAQDVIEHAADPREALKMLGSLVTPEGLIAIGTPNAAGIDFSHAAHIHPLHQPYHRHIFAFDALERLVTDELGWSLHKYHDTPYTNMPIISLPFIHHYMRAQDNTIDVLFDRLTSVKLWLNPKTYFMLIFGYFMCDDADIVAVFKAHGPR